MVVANWKHKGPQKSDVGKEEQVDSGYQGGKKDDGANQSNQKYNDNIERIAWI